MVGDNMRRIIILLCVFLLCGCDKTLDIHDKITEIKYNNIYIDEDDFSEVKKLINTSYSKGEDKDLANKLTIKTTDDIYYFSLSNEEIKYDGKVASNTKLNSYLQGLTKKYTDKNFYTIDYMKNYEANSDEQTILLDKTSNYIVINFGKKVSNLKINEIEIIDDKYVDTNLIYSLEDVNKDKVIIRKSINYENPDIRISFENEYGYIVSIIPIYNNDTLEFKTTFKAK